jgi:hypothetical protein
MRSVVAAAVCMAGLVGVIVAAQGSLAKHPIVGKWKLNAAKSTVGVTLEFSGAPDATMTMAWAGQKYTFKMDGKDYPAPFDSSAAWTQKGAGQWDAVYKVRGKVDNTDHISLSADGKTLTVRTDRVASKTPEELVFQRVSGGPGLAGVWKSVRAAADATAEYAVNGDKLVAHIEPSGERWTGPLDGKDYPVAAGPSIPRGETWAGRQDGPRTIKFVLRLNGMPVQYATLTVLPDGKTLEIVQINGATESAPNRNRLIYERQ